MITFEEALSIVNNSAKEKAFETGYINPLAVNYMNEADMFDKNILNRHGVSATTNYDSGIFYINKAFINTAFN